jgi:hypothetical protein
MGVYTRRLNWTNWKNDGLVYYPVSETLQHVYRFTFEGSGKYGFLFT